MPGDLVVLSGGLGLYQGRCDAVVGWFEGDLGYGPWDSAVHGTASDWVMDLVNVGFSKSEVYGVRGGSGGLDPSFGSVPKAHGHRVGPSAEGRAARAREVSGAWSGAHALDVLVMVGLLKGHPATLCRLLPR